MEKGKIDIKNCLKGLFAFIVFITFICQICVSGALAQYQWPSYSNTAWLSRSFFNPSYLLDPTSSHTGLFNNYTGPLNNPFLFNVFPFQGTTNATGIYSPYNVFNRSGFFPSPFSIGIASPVGYSGPGGYPLSINFSPLSSYLQTPFSPLSWIGGPYIGTGIYGPFSSPFQFPGGYYDSITPIQQPVSYCDPAYAPGKMKGEWLSNTLKDESNKELNGELIVSLANNASTGIVTSTGTVNMLDSSLSLGEGSLVQFNYTRTQGNAPISFKAQFYSGYTAEFSGTADNRLCCRNHFCAFAGVFDVDGNYVIKDNSGKVVDNGIIKISGPAYSSTPTPTPVAAIKSIGKPIAEGNKILSLTTGSDGLIYGGTDIGCVNVGRMFAYNPAIRSITDLGNPGYECNAMTTGKDGLIYLGGGTRSSGNHNCAAIGYANFAIYDPGRPWNPGSGTSSNPRDLGQAVSFSGEVYGYPIVVHDLATAPDGKIYGCTGYRDGENDEYYAYLFVYDPQTGQINNLDHPIPNQSSITRLAIASDGIIYGVILGPRTGYRPPPGKLFSYNPASATFAIINIPSTIQGVVALAAGTDGLIYLAGGENNSTIFTYDPVSKSFDEKGNLGGCGEVLRMICAADGIIYIGCEVNGYFVMYDPERTWQASPQSDENNKPGVNPRVFHWTGKVNALTEGHDGTIYFGNLSGELYYFAGED